MTELFDESETDVRQSSDTQPPPWVRELIVKWPMLSEDERQRLQSWRRGWLVEHKGQAADE